MADNRLSCHRVRNFMKHRILPVLTLILLAASAHARDRWTPEEAAAWQKRTGWLVGCNYIPSTAINQLEMWQADTFDPVTIDRELGWAHDLGFNSVRVFLHHLLWEQDKAGFLKRMEKFLDIADKHKIGVMFVPLDSVWDPHPKLGKQREPKKGVHNSGWVQSPGAEIFGNPSRHDELEGYIKGVIDHFKNDRRVQVWDVINEADNGNHEAYGKVEVKDKSRLATMLLGKVFKWARAVDPSQPLTSGVWAGDWSEDSKLAPHERAMIDNSDIVSFHNYGNADDMKRRIAQLRRFNRPIVCTEYMARGNGSTFDPILGILKEEKVGAYNWGFVDGKSQTIYPWDSWRKAYDAPPKVWFHDIFRADGTPYSRAEVEYIRRVTKK
jgi:hypothetical protein